MSKFTFHCGCVSHEDAFTEEIQGCPILHAYTLQGRNGELRIKNAKLQAQNEDLKKHLEIMRLAAYEGGIMLLNLLPENYLKDEEE